MNFADALATVHRARTPADLFDPAGSGADPAAVYRQLAKALHPDVVPATRTAAATSAFVRLAALWQEHQRPHASFGGTVITTRLHSYRLGELLADGDLANVFRVDFDGREGLLKLPRRPADNDLMRQEAAALRTMARDGDPKFRPYVPKLIESFQHRDGAVERTGNVTDFNAGLVSLARVAESFPDGVDPRDVAWMWRRLLVALGHAHRCGLVHGAVLPEHVLIEPAEHGLTLVDWCYSTAPGGKVPALVERYRDWYPPEVPAGQPAGPGTDIYLATECMRRLMGRRAHPRLLAFARGCALPQLRRRPSDAWRLLGEFDELIEELYGPRKFRPFALPR